jgi:IS30 family transposase
MRWKSIIADLLKSGLTQPQIADACNCRQTTISALYTGKTIEPRYSLGRALERLRQKRRRENARRNPHDSVPPQRNVPASGVVIHPNITENRL